MMLWVKAFHIIAVVAWFAGLFYLPRLFVYHAGAKDAISIQRFKTMEYRLYYGITWPAGLLTTALGIGLILFQPDYYLKVSWMHAKLTLVLMVWGYHLLCGHYLRLFAKDCHVRTVNFYRLFNEVPTVLLVCIVILVVVKP